MKALVTGGLGFIGSHLCERLLRDGHTVAIVDDLSTGSRENIAHLGDPPELSCYVDTVLNTSLLERLIRQSDVVFHLAAVVGVRRVLDAPLKCLSTNITGTATILEASAKCGAKVLIASSSEVYGKNGSGSLAEDDPRVLGSAAVPRWVYSVSKMADECLALSYWRERDLPVVVMRFFNIVGPRQTGRYGMVLPTFARQALSNLPITVYGDGKQVRSFTYVSDAVDAMVALAASPAAIGEVFNVGSEETIAIGSLAQRVKEAAHSGSPIKYIPFEVAFGSDFEEPYMRVPDISKLRAYVGYEPKVRLHEMIDNVLADSRAQEGVRREREATEPTVRAGRSAWPT